MSLPFAQRTPNRLATAFALLLLATPLAFSNTVLLIGAAASRQSDELRKLDGEWIFVEDRTPGHSLEQLGPPMSSKFSLRSADGAVILVYGQGAGHKDTRIALDGSVTEIIEPATTYRYSGSWKDGIFRYQTEYFRGPDKTPDGAIKREFQVTNEGLLVRVITKYTDEAGNLGLYRLAKDIPLPTPAKATINDVNWIAGNWVASRPTGSTFEERWTAPKGGAMLATSQSVNASGRMFAFEFLRIVERNGGLVYIAQPNGAAPTEFTLTELTTKRAVFDNPRHDYPQRIVYELRADGGLTASTGQLKGGTPRLFEFKREGG